MYDVVILTDERYVNPKRRNDYIDNVMKEDQLIMDALIALDFHVIKVAWSDPNFDWSKTKYALFRTVWDYAERFQEFSDWLMKVSMHTRLINAYETIIWNLDKNYLTDLKEVGVDVVETFYMEPGYEKSLVQTLEKCGWEKAVLKPAISATARDTYALTSENVEQHEEDFQRLIRNEKMMLQPFQQSVVERGEISLMIIGGHYTHAVLKKAKKGDFRVQDDFGGTVHAYEPSQDEIFLAQAAVEACDIPPLYARVDIVNDNAGNPAVSELELIEPELWFRRHEEAATILAMEVQKLYNREHHNTHH